MFTAVSRARRFEDVLLVMDDIESAQEVQIFLPKRLPAMMLFPVLDVADEGREQRKEDTN